MGLPRSPSDEIFFALSGFLMGHLYFDRPATAGNIRQFFQRRIARVLPLYLAVVAISFGLTQAFADSRYWAYNIGANQLLPHLLFLRGESVLWTIPVEVHFYLLFPILWLLRSYVGAWVPAILTGGIVVIFLTQGLLLPSTGGIESLAFYGHYFLAGLLIAMLPVLPASRWWDALFLASLVGTLLLYPRISQLVPLPSDTVAIHLTAEAMWRNPLYLLAVTVLLLSAIQSRLAHAILGSGPFRFLGAISYSLYLLHMPPLEFLDRFTSLREDTWLFVSVANVLIFALAALSYIALERPARILINSIHMRRSRNLSNA